MGAKFNQAVFAATFAIMLLAADYILASDICPVTETHVRVHYAAKSIEENVVEAVTQQLPQISQHHIGKVVKFDRKADAKKCSRESIHGAYEKALRAYDKKVKAIQPWVEHERQKWRERVEREQEKIQKKNANAIQSLQNRIAVLSSQPYDINDPEWQDKVRAQQKTITDLNKQIRELMNEQPVGDEYDFGQFESELKEKVLQRKAHTSRLKPDTAEYLKKAWKTCPTAIPLFLANDDYKTSFEGLAPAPSDVSGQLRINDLNIQGLSLDCTSSSKGQCRARVKLDRLDVSGQTRIVTNEKYDHDRRKKTPRMAIGAERSFRIQAKQPIDVEFDIALNGEHGVPTIVPGSMQTKNLSEATRRHLSKSVSSKSTAYLDIDDQLGVETGALANQLVGSETVGKALNSLFAQQISPAITGAMQSKLEEKLKDFKGGRKEVPPVQSIISSIQAAEILDRASLSRDASEIKRLIGTKSDLWSHIERLDASTRSKFVSHALAKLDEIQERSTDKIRALIDEAKARAGRTLSAPSPKATSSWDYQMRSATYDPKTQNYVMDYTGCPNKEMGFVSTQNPEAPPPSCYAENDLVMQIDVNDMNNYFKSLYDSGYFNFCDRYNKSGQCVSETKLRSSPILQINHSTGEVKLVLNNIKNTQTFIVPIHSISDLEISAPLMRHTRGRYLEVDNVSAKIAGQRTTTVFGKIVGIPDGALPLVGWVLSKAKNDLHKDKLAQLRPKLATGVNALADRHMFTKEIRVTPGTQTLNIYGDLLSGGRNPKLHPREGAGPECSNSEAITPRAVPRQAVR